MSRTFDFGQSLTDAYRPQSLDQFCGLDRHKRIISNFAANPRSCGLLFVGAPGTGKTTLAFTLARMIRGEVHHVTSQECKLENLQSVVAMCHRVPYNFQTGEACAWHVVIIDEADACSDAAQKYLLSKLDGSDACPATVFVLTANSAERFEDRFLSRLIKLPPFNSYGAGADIKALLSRIWSERSNAPLPDLSRIPTGNVRESLQALEVELLSA
ncbi:MAG: ATP-binding protein [Candidatus Acidiferrales bacterium]